MFAPSTDFRTKGEAAVTRLLILSVVLLTLSAGPAAADRYNPRKAGHPLRIAAYALHPAGVLVDYLIFRPAWWLGQHEPLRTIFGVRGDETVEVEPPREPESGSPSE